MAVSIEGITKNNTLVGTTLNIPPLRESLQQLKLGAGIVKSVELLGEEANDGCLAKSFKYIAKGGSGDLTIADGDTLDVYRTNMYSLDTVKVASGLPFSRTTAVTVKDYSVEMGEDYIYVGGVRNENGILKGLVASPYPWNYSNGGYARLMKMDSTFLTTKNHQLRLQGNVTVSSLKRNTQDQFQTTIGSAYPFYSRNSKMNYRTFSLSGVVSVAFDPTATFLENDRWNGLWWNSDDGNQLVVLNRDLYQEQQFSLSRRRLKDTLTGGESVERLDIADQAY